MNHISTNEFLIFKQRKERVSLSLYMMIKKLDIAFGCRKCSLVLLTFMSLVVIWLQKDQMKYLPPPLVNITYFSNNKYLPQHILDITY